MEFSRERRRMLLSTIGWFGGAAALVAARPGNAFEITEMSPQSSLGTMVANRCGPQSEHAAIVAELQAKLTADPALASLTTSCPLCGCPVSVAR